ncbi:MAG: hypothetical protein ACKUBY_03745 [Candidatus Moraniibacteriota bacterium]|jgi:hypothetical protein
MNELLKETQSHIKETLQLTSKSLYKTIEFQLLFKIFYISIFIFIINFLIGTFLDVIDLLITKMRLGEALKDIPIISLFDFNIIFVLLTSLFIIIYIYLLEKNGVIIITSNYYRNNFISFFKTLLLSIRKTPRFIFRRLYEMRIIILIYVLMYILWKILELFSLPELIMTTLSIFLVLYGAGIFFAVLFRYTFTAYTTCLEPDESYQEFNEKMPYKFLRKRTYATSIFYITFFIGALLWLFIFYGITQVLLHLVYSYPEAISIAFAFFIAFTIMSVLIMLSMFKTLKVSLMTILYYEERKRQNKHIEMKHAQKQPLLSKNIYMALITILVIALFGGVFITTTIKTKTDLIITNAQAYIEEVRENNTLHEIDIENINLQYILKESISNDTSTLETIERVIFTFLAYIIIK